jgi:hypothetical protein
MNGVDLNQIGEVSSGFILVIIIMVGVSVGLLVFFIKKQWVLVRENRFRNGSDTQREREEPAKENNDKSHVEYHIFKSENRRK